jgi:hypothetical protein
MEGMGPAPKAKTPLNAICSPAVATKITDGVFMLPVPRKTEASVLINQTKTAPENKTWLY